MKLLAVFSKNWCVFSVSHYDYRTAPDGIMADAGQPGTLTYGGYTRSSGPMTWIELPNVDFLQLTEDYQFGRPQKYGVHKIEEVRILSPEEIPDVNSIEWKVENAVWGTRGPKGNDKLKYIFLKDAETSHLEALLDYTQNERVQEVVKAILESRQSTEEDHTIMNKARIAQSLPESFFKSLIKSYNEGV